MAKAKLTEMTAKWVSGKTVKQQAVNGNGQVKKQTIYISRAASKLLWQTRIDTGESISRTVENLVLKHLKKV